MGVGKEAASVFGFVVFLFVVALLLPAALEGAAGADGAEPIIGPGEYLYGTQEAADLVAEARTYDPLYCTTGKPDRDRAALLYEQAIAAQPGAAVNAPLANRIAQMYAYYGDPQAGIQPVPEKAVEWWRRCAELTSADQVLWGQAYVGLASTGVVGRDYRATLDACRTVLEMGADQMSLPDWEVWRPRDLEPGSAARRRLADRFGRLQASTVKVQFYALCHVDKGTAVVALQDAARAFERSPAGTRALELLAEFRETNNLDPWALSGVELTKQIQVVDDTSEPEPAVGLRLQMPRPAAPERSAGSGGRSAVGACAAVATGAVLALAGLLGLRRWRRLSRVRDGGDRDGIR